MNPGIYKYLILSVLLTAVACGTSSTTRYGEQDLENLALRWDHTRGTGADETDCHEIRIGSDAGPEFNALVAKEMLNSMGRWSDDPPVGEGCAEKTVGAFRQCRVTVTFDFTHSTETTKMALSDLYGLQNPPESLTAIAEFHYSRGFSAPRPPLREDCLNFKNEIRNDLALFLHFSEESPGIKASMQYAQNP